MTRGAATAAASRHRLAGEQAARHDGRAIVRDCAAGWAPRTRRLEYNRTQLRSCQKKRCTHVVPPCPNDLLQWDRASFTCRACVPCSRRRSSLAASSIGSGRLREPSTPASTQHTPNAHGVIHGVIPWCHTLSQPRETPAGNRHTYAQTHSHSAVVVCRILIHEDCGDNGGMLESVNSNLLPDRSLNVLVCVTVSCLVCPAGTLSSTCIRLGGCGDEPVEDWGSTRGHVHT